MHQQEKLVGAMLLHSTRTSISSSCKCQGLDSKLKNSDKSSLLIISIFLSLVGFGSKPSYFLYQHISSFHGAHYIKLCSLQFRAVWSFRLWRWSMTFPGTEMKELGRNLWQYSQQKIVAPNFQTSPVCHRRLAVGRNQQVKEYKHTHTHTHTHTHARRCPTKL